MRASLAPTIKEHVLRQTWTRRGVLSASLASAALAPLRAGGAPEVLTAALGRQQMLPDPFGPTKIWGFDGVAPGPEIRIAKGGRLRRRVLNRLDEPTSVHWHGIRIENAMDGVAGLTQAPIRPGESFDYDFSVPDAGTFWYHAHSRSFEQVARGLYGPLIVEEDAPLDIDAEHVLMLDDWRIDPETGQIMESFGNFHDRSHAGRLGNFATTNGVYNLAVPARAGARLRLRLVNAATARVMELGLEGMRGWIVALDGMPLVAPRPLEVPVTLGPAQRVDLLADVTVAPGETAHLVAIERGEAFSQVAFETTKSAAQAPRPAPAALEPNIHAIPDIANAVDLELHMNGGAMGGMAEARMDGQATGLRDLAQAGMFWALNGAVSRMTDPPLAELPLGQSVRMALINDTAFPHAMHLHGMHFYELGQDDRLGALRDTTLVPTGETRRVAFVADNPGDWLLHCHMLAHAVSGMTTRLVVG